MSQETHQTSIRACHMTLASLSPQDCDRKNCTVQSHLKYLRDTKIAHYTFEHWEDIQIIRVDENDIKSPPFSVAYVRQWTVSALVKIMACRLFGAKPLSKPMLVYHPLDHWEQTSMKFWSKWNLFIHENGSQNIVCEMATILSRGGWVKYPTRLWSSECIYGNYNWPYAIYMT